MYDTLTSSELSKLAAKLCHAGGAFYKNAASIANTALYLQESGRITALSSEWNGLWALRQPYVDAMTEMHGLMFEADAAAAARDA